MHFSIVVVLLFIQLFGFSLGQTSVCRPEVLESKTQYVRYKESDIVYNSVHNEYLFIWIEPGINDTIKIQRYDLNINPVGDIVTILNDHSIKTYISGAFNPRNRTYTIVFEYDGDLYDRNIGIFGVIAHPELQVWFGVESLYSGVDRHPAIAYNSLRNYFLLVYTHYEPSDPESGYDLIIQILNDVGYPSDPYVTILRLPADDKDPVIYYNEQRDEFLVLYAIQVLGSSDIGRIIIDGSGLSFPYGFYIVARVSDNDTYHVHEDQPQVTFSPATGNYFMTWEVDIYGQGDEPFETDVFAQTLNSTGFINSDLFALSQLPGNVYKYKDASVDYDPRGREYVIVFSNHLDNESTTTDIGYVSLHDTTYAAYYIPRLNQASRTEHVPELRYAAASGDLFVAWASGNYSHPQSKKRSEELLPEVDPAPSSMEAPSLRRSDVEAEEDIEILDYAFVRQSIQGVVPFTRHATPNNNEHLIEKRQPSNGNIRTAKICLPLSSTITTGATTGVATTTTTTTTTTTGATSGAATTTQQTSTSTTTSTSGRTSTIGTDSTTGASINTQDSPSSGSDSGTVALAVIIPLLIVIIAIVAIILYLRWRKKQKENAARINEAAAELSERERQYG